MHPGIVTWCLKKKSTVNCVQKQTTKNDMGKNHIKLDLRNTNLVVKWDSLYHEMHAKKRKKILINRLIKKD
jgi:hypothetical protein